MRSLTQLSLFGLVAVLAWPLTAGAQFNSETLSFEDTPRDDPTLSSNREVFRCPGLSGSTRGIIANTPSAESGNFNSAYRSSLFGGSAGSAACEVFFWWDAANATPWVRLTTFDTGNRPNPSLHTQGKLRFKIFNLGDPMATQGNIALCVAIRETGIQVPQLWNGSTAGPIELVGVTTALTVIECGTNGCQSTPAGGSDDVVVTWGTNSAISGGPNRVLDPGYTLAGDDVANNGYVRATDGGFVPVPAVTIPVEFGGDYEPFEVNLVNGDVTYKTVTTDGAIISFNLGDGILNAPNDRGTLEALVITRDMTDPVLGMDFFIDELQVEAPAHDPIVPPEVVAPIVDGQPSVTVRGLVPTVTKVSLYRNTDPTPIDALVSPGTGVKQVVIPVSPNVATGDVFKATQTDDKTPTPQVSGYSPPVTALAGPPPYTFSLLMNEEGTGNSCAFSVMEWVGVTSTSVWVPQGVGVSPKDGEWQNVDIPLDNDDLVLAFTGGNGSLDPSAAGNYLIDTMWFTVSPDANSSGVGPWEVFIDAVQTLDASNNVLGTLMSFEDSINRIQLARSQSSTPVTSSALSSAASYDGSSSHRLLWSYNLNLDGSMILNQSLGMMQRTGWTCGNSVPIVDIAAKVRFHMLCRTPSTNTVPLPAVVGPIIKGTNTTCSVRVTNDATATSVQLWVNGALHSSLTPTGTSTDFTLLALNVGDSVSAKQVLPAGTSDLAYPRVVALKPPPPMVTPPIYPGAATVTVTNLLNVQFADASDVVVWKNVVDEEGWTTYLGFKSAPLGVTETVTLTNGTVTSTDVVLATQVVNGKMSDPSAPVSVAFPGPVIFKAPAAGDTTVKVLALLPGTDSVIVHVNPDNVDFTLPVSGDPTSVEVTVNNLNAGDTLTAQMTVNTVPSAPSEPETVTTSTTNPVWCDGFEYANQAAFEAIWTPRTQGTGTLTLTADQNTTPGGSKSLLSANTSNWKLLAEPVTPTPQAPIVLTTSIYDTGGSGVSRAQFVDLWGRYFWDATGAYFMLEVGMWNDPSSMPDHLTRYGLRLLGGGPNWVQMDQYEAPVRSVGWHSFTVVHKGLRVDAYVDGKLALKNIVLSSTLSVQVVKVGSAPYGTGTMYTDDYCATTGPVRFVDIGPQPPPAPTLNYAVVANDTCVEVSGIVPTATSVTVYDGAISLGTSVPLPVGTNSFCAAVSPALVYQGSITAKQTSANGTSQASNALEVGNGSGPVKICIGIRETGDSNPLGTPGGTTGTIEFVGATTKTTGGAPQGIYTISPSGTWQTLTFDPAVTSQIFPLDGNGVINGTRGTLEHLAVAVDSASPSRSTGPYNLYVDNVVNVGAGPGNTDVLITDFEGFTPGVEVLFQEPTYSGSTYPAHLVGLPSASAATAAKGNPGQSEWLRWFWKDTTADRWARISTGGVANKPSPIIDLTKPIRMHVLLTDAVPGDMDADGDVDLTDYAAWAACLAGPNVGTPPGGCTAPQFALADLDGDLDVDEGDFADFQVLFP